MHQVECYSLGRIKYLLSHLPRMYVLVIWVYIGSDNGLSPIRDQAII